MTAQELQALIGSIPPLDSAAEQAARARLDRLTKPPGSLGVLEDIVAQLAAITGRVQPALDWPAVLVAAADHGVVAEGVSPYPQAVTAQMVRNFLRGGAAVNALAAAAGARVIVVDAGVAADLPDHPDLRRRRSSPAPRSSPMRRGTGWTCWRSARWASATRPPPPA